LVFCALIIVICYVIITINFIVTMVESYILVSVGFVFLGFGGSRWTAPYVERFIGLAVAIGIKILLLYCLIAAGMGLGLTWIDEAQSVSAVNRPLMVAFDVMGAAVIFMMLCWQIPRLFAGVLGGAPALTGGELVGTLGTIVGGAWALGSTIGAGAGMIGGGVLASKAVGAGAAGGGGSASGASSAIAGVGAAKGAGGGTGAVAPPSSASAGVAGTGGAVRSQPDPPLRAASSQTAMSAIGGQSLVGSGFESERTAKGFQPASHVIGVSDAPASAQQTLFEEAGAPATAIATSMVTGVPAAHSGASPIPAPVRRTPGVVSVVQRFQRGLVAMRRRIPSDAAPLTTPPRMPIDHHED
jgi:type IV secretion system protein TrbL